MRIALIVVAVLIVAAGMELLLETARRSPSPRASALRYGQA